MSGLKYKDGYLKKVNKSLLSASGHIKRLNRTLGQWGYYGLIASTLLVSCIQEATGNIKPNFSTQSAERIPSSELCVIESKPLSTKKTACAPQLASGGFSDWLRILKSNKFESYSKPLNKTAPYWERNLVEPYQ